MKHINSSFPQTPSLQSPPLGEVGRGSLFLLLLFLLPLCSRAQQFEDYFVDKTLRLDYIFSGDAKEQSIAVDELCMTDGWYGKRQHLADVPVQGNGQVIVRSKQGNVIYRNSFSTLFQEWITYDEAKEKRRAFENVFLVPMPKDTVQVTVELYNNRRQVMTTMTHRVEPQDVLIRHIPQQHPYETVMAAKTDKRINVAFVAEGYKAEEMDVFLSDVREACDALFAHQPFTAFKDRFNIVAVKSASQDSGTSEPAQGQWLNTVLHSNFDTFYSDRYLTTLHLKDLHTVLAGIPYEHIIVLVNTEKYGGGGILNSYNLSMTHHPAYRKVVVHEFGHSFAGLADEYAYEAEQLEQYPHDVEPWEQNITTKVDFASKWQDMLGAPGTTGSDVSIYEGAGYSLKGVYRPCNDCRMRSNDTPNFCPVCQRAITRLIQFYTEKHD